MGDAFQQVITSDQLQNFMSRFKAGTLTLDDVWAPVWQAFRMLLAESPMVQGPHKADILHVIENNFKADVWNAFKERYKADSEAFFKETIGLRQKREHQEEADE